ncbi:F0F1 ATP synthase subunit epsilon [Profundibacter amoris]|uniref:ATP synthase epsilon chain n=1 Tax=Profundibacter amoris TaxID=2171755 RepID=A0A347UIX7_9RHOB|nr:F0F1 ATP synthase subunit epsilon [Profundibacter amoris]AXX98805.1 F0F1 ATP synthase subunit epsilon [Profundibacter amoris]HGG65869.1 F0F1 ATP synthase subunit epsilon [Paracoccaceae bacterium]
MADTMQFDLVSPERSLASLQATEVMLPAAEGDMTVLPDHAPVITTLRPGVVKVNGPEGEADFVVTGGFVEITSEGVSVLAEQAHAGNEVKKADLESAYTFAREQAEKASDEDKSAAEKLVADFAQLLEDME